MQKTQLQECLDFLHKNKGWETSIGSPLKEECDKVLESLGKSTTTPENWNLPLRVALKHGTAQHINSVLSALSDLYCHSELHFNLQESNIPFLVEVGNILSEFSKDISASCTLQITRFCLGVINGESSCDSPIHGQTILNYFQAIFACAIYGTNQTEKTGARTALTQAVQIIASRFEAPPIYDTEISLLAYQLSRRITFSCINNDLFDLLDNSASIPPPSNVYENDALLLLKALCNNSLAIAEGTEGNTQLKSALFSIELATAFLSVDKEVMFTSLRYLQLVKNLVCSLVLRHTHSSSFPVFRATLSLCHTLMMRYRDILKAEASVFFSSLFFRIIDTDAPKLFKNAVIDRIERFSPSFLAEIFVNFDCDIDLQEANIFEHLISSLIKSADNEIESLKCIATMLKQLNDWSRQHKTKTISPFDKTRKLKALYSKAIDAFNADPEHNLHMLIESGLVKEDPKSVAAFFHSHRTLLNPTGVGLILGNSKPFQKEIMHEYIDQIEFTSLSLVEALYKFLSMFRLPPESQQIDRIIEKFAHAFYLSHGDEFKSASIVYDAAFAIVILHTDAHNMQVKHKMEKNEFIKLYRGMDEGDALPTNYLETIYDYVVAHEITLLGSNQSMTMLEDFRSPTQKGVESYKQSLEHIHDAQKRMRSSVGSEIRWVCPVNPDTVRPMFETIWMPLNALSAKILSEGGSDEAISSALTILTSSIDISARFYMETESTFCMSSLCIFTRLQPWTPIHIQNIRAIRELLDMSTNFSSFYEPVWEKMLSLFAQLNYFMLAHNTSLPADHSLAEIAQKNAEIVSEFVPLADIDALFEASANFPSTAIVPFVTALCKVSNNEFGQRPPRTFCLQKIVEVTAFNMERARFVWTQIWKPISQHLIEAGCFPQEGIARSALDSLRQLAGKFLAREELQSFHYQRDFLKPFHSILRKSKSKAVRLHALRCLNHTVHAYHDQMKSGWEAVFNMLESAATIVEVNRLALTVLIDILEQHLQSIVDEHLMDGAIKAIAKFLIIGRCVGESAIYVIAGVFEKMMEIKFEENDIKPLFNVMVRTCDNPYNVSIILPIVKKSMDPKIWPIMTNSFLIPILNDKTSKWFNTAGLSIVEWAVPSCANSDPSTAVKLIITYIQSPNSKILSICATSLKQLYELPEAAEAATLLARSLAKSFTESQTSQQNDLMEDLVVDLAPCLKSHEVKLLIESMKKVDKSEKAILALSSRLLANKEMGTDEYKTMATKLFDSEDDMRNSVLNELLRLDKELFNEIATGLSVKAAQLISTKHEGLSQSLSKFFVRMSQDCFVNK